MANTFWDKASARYDDDIQKREGLYAATMERTRSLLTPTDVVMDFACASGEMSLDIAAHVQEVHGIDLSQKMIELANQKANQRQVDNVRFEQVDVFDGRLVPQAYSVIVAFNIFHLVDDAPAVLARLHALLSDGGVLISQTPCLGEWNWPLRTVMGLAQRVNLAPSIRSFKIAELESMVRNQQFEIFDSQLWDEKHAVQWIAARK